MSWANIKRIWLRELRDQMRDRRTLFTVAVLPLLLYPLMGMVILQVSQFKSSAPTRIWVIGQEELPASPPLFFDKNGQLHLASEGEDELLEIVAADTASLRFKSSEEAAAAAKKAIDDGEFDAVVYFPPDFSERLAAASRNGGEVPQPKVFGDSSKDKSSIAEARISDALARWQDKIVAKKLEDRGISIVDIHPFEVATVDIADPSSRRAHVWSKILPFVLMIWALTGAFYPAIDLCAGEKERGTLETLLTSPAKRGEIVWGKLLAVTTFSIATAILNLVSLGATGSFVMRAVDPTGMAIANFGPPPLASMAWLLLALVPAAFMFSALALAIAAMARSSKEGQYYLMPLLLVSLPLMILPVLPTTELSLGTAVVPITGLILILRRLIEADFAEALRYAAPVLGVTILCVWLSIRWCIDQFNKEEVLFRESEQFTVGLWLRHLIRDRQPTPGVSMALLFGVLLLVVRFFSMLAFPLLGLEQNWATLTLTTFITLVCLIALPTVAMAFIFTSRPRETLLLQRPLTGSTVLLSIPAALLLAICIHPLVHVVGEAVGYVFPISEATKTQFATFKQMLEQAPNLWSVIALLAFTPAVCEELAFRGFVLSGLRHMGHKWGAIVISAMFFGVAHGLLQQSVMACLTGVLLGYIAVQTGSLWPCIVYHFANNAIAILIGAVNTELVQAWPVLDWLFVAVEDGYAFHWWLSIAGGLVAAALLYWFARLPHQSSSEEELQKALDHQQAAPLAGSQRPAESAGR